jgi:hypothetical protein
MMRQSWPPPPDPWPEAPPTDPFPPAPEPLPPPLPPPDAEPFLEGDATAEGLRIAHGRSA